MRTNSIYAVADSRPIITGDGSYSMASNAVAIVPRPDRTDETLAKDVLLAMGKRSKARRMDSAGSSMTETATAWIEATSIEHVLIYNAQWLDRGSDFVTVQDLSEVAQVWLLFDESPDMDVVDGLGVADRIVKPTSLEHALRHNPDAVSEYWEDFPEVCSDSAITFRGRCASHFDAVEMERIDALMRDGASFMLNLVRGEEPNSADVARGVVSVELPIWPAVCHLRGAELGALWGGYRLEVDFDAWFEFRRARPDLCATVKEVLVAEPDPRNAVLLTSVLVCNAAMSAVVALNVDAIAPDCESIEMRGARHYIPPELRPLFKVYMTLTHRNSAPSDPLFIGQTGARLRASRARSLCDQISIRASAGRFAELGESVAVFSGADLKFINLRRLEGEDEQPS